MWKLTYFLRPYRKTAIIALLLMLGELAAELWQPMFMAKIIDEGVMPKDSDVALKWGIIMILISLAGFVSGIINSYYSSYVSQGVAYDVRKQLFERVQSFSFSTFNHFQPSTLITRLTNDISQIQMLVFMSLRVMLKAPLMMVGGLIMALTINLKLSLVLVVITPLLLVMMIWMMGKSFKLFRRVQERLDRTNGVLRENLLGMRLIKAFVRFDHEKGRFSKANEDLRDRTMSALRLVELTVPMLLLVMNFSLLFILWYGGREVIFAQVDVGEVIAIVNYTTRITASFSMISWIVAGISRAKASSVRISEVLDTEADQSVSEDADASLKVRRGEIEFDRVSFQYPGASSPLLTSISFTAPAGGAVAILGATGSGKSSLFQLIPRLYEPNRGRIRIDGMDIRRMTMESLRDGMGYVPQEAILFSGTVKENLLWGKEDASMEEIIEAAKSAQIHDTIIKLPLQYETVLGQQGVNLSGGQKQRLSIARALIRKPRILLLDDSTSALDARTEAKLLAALKKLSCTTLMITQKISTAMESDTILILEDGKLLAEGSHETLLLRSPLYRKIIESQFGKELAQGG